MNSKKNSFSLNAFERHLITRLNLKKFLFLQEIFNSVYYDDESIYAAEVFENIAGDVYNCYLAEVYVALSAFCVGKPTSENVPFFIYTQNYIKIHPSKNRQKFVKKNNKKWVRRSNTTYVPKSVFMRVLLKITKADKTTICFIRRYHISSVTRMVDVFGQNRQKKSSKNLRKNFLDVVCGRFPHLVAVVDIRPDDGGNTVT